MYNNYGDNVKELNKYQMTYFIRFIGDSMFYPFFALYLSSIGVENKELGVIMMILPLIAIFVNPMWSHFSKNVNSNRLFLRILTIIEALMIVLLIGRTSTEAIVIITIMIAIAGQPFYIMLDGFTSFFSKANGFQYGNIRLYGSLSYALGTLAAGYLIKLYGYGTTFYLAGFFFVITGVLIHWMKPLDLSIDLDLDEKSDLKSLVRNKRYLLFAMYYIILLGTIFGADAFLGVYFETLGVETDAFGWITFYFIIGEILVLFILSKFGHLFKTRNILILMAIMNAIRYFSYGFGLPLVAMIIISASRSISMGGILYISIRYMTEITSSKNLTLGILLYSSFRSLLTAIITVVGGYVTDFYGYQSFYVIVGIIALIGLGFINYKESQKPLEM